MQNKRDWAYQKKKRNSERNWSALLIGCGIVLLILLGIGKDMAMEQGDAQREEGKNAREQVGVEHRIPMIRFLQNAFILEVERDRVTVFEEGERKQYQINGDLGLEMCGKREEIADLVLTDEKVTWISVKEQRIHGKVHDWGEDHVTLEEYGRLELDPDYKGYRLYDKMKMMGVFDLRLGEEDADYIMEDGKICAILFVREEKMEDIRVLIRTKGYQDIYHDEIELQGEQGFWVCFQEERDWKEIHYEPGTSLKIDRGSQFFKGEEKRVKVIPDHLTGNLKVLGLCRDMGDPGFTGELEISAQKDGLVLINLLPLEEYLYYVVPSEMPASYPMEALKAQAICARTYACGFLQHAGYPALGAHVDDSVRFQVYHNLDSQEGSTQAVKETYGIVLTDGFGDLAETYYYSTSCGRGTDEAAWGNETEKKDYLKGKKISRGETGKNEKEDDETKAGGAKDGETRDTDTMDWDLQEEKDETAEFLREVDQEDYECDFPWYRWSYQVNAFDLTSFSNRLKANLETEVEMAPFQKVLNMRITQRGSGGVALCLEIETDGGSYEVYGEHGIRSVLCEGNTKVKRGDGAEAFCQNLLPSAFFLLETSNQGENVVGYILTGGGYGHGIGMSQNAARKMAEEGRTAEDILDFFYEGCSYRKIY